MTNQPWDSARVRALARMDRLEWRFYLFAALLMVVDMLFLWGFMRLADFSNKVHVLIFWSTACLFTTVILGGIIGFAFLRNHVSEMTRVVLKAIDASRDTVMTGKVESPTKSISG